MQNRKLIIQAAIGLFRENGLAFTMQDVAASIHIAKKTIYADFFSKEDLLIAMLDYGFERIHADKEAIMKKDLPIREKLYQTMIAMPEQYTYLDFRQLSGMKEKYPRAFEALKQHLETGWEPVNELMEEGIRTHQLRSFPVALIREIFTASIESFLNTDTLREAEVDYADALNMLMDIIMNGIREESHEKNQ